MRCIDDRSEGFKDKKACENWLTRFWLTNFKALYLYRCFKQAVFLDFRDALQKLEFYGILRTLPQSGTVVAGMGIAALEGLITDVLQLEESDFHSLVETPFFFISALQTPVRTAC